MITACEICGKTIETPHRGIRKAGWKKRVVRPGRFAYQCRACAAGKKAGAYSPDFVKALEACLQDLEHYASTHGLGPDKRLAAARAALAKAKGE